MMLRSVNLNLLPVLQALLRDASVSRAAEAVGLSQPAASRALAQLRSILGDPLLVRVGATLVLTPRAEALRTEVDAACRQVAAVWAPARFDPAHERREIVIASADYAPLLLVPILWPLLQAQAPGVTLRFADWRPDDLTDSRRATDFVIGPVDLLHRAGAGAVDALFHDSFVPVVAATHPLAGQSPSREDIDAFPHILFTGGDPGDPGSEAIGAMMGRPPPLVVAHVRQFATLPLLALSTGAVAIMPRRLAEITGRDLAITILDEPEPRARVAIGLGWHARFAADPAHRWFRSLAIEALRQLDVR